MIRGLLLGVDGGGTSTEAWLADSGGEVIGRGVSGPSNAKAVGMEAARRALDAAIRAAFDDAGLEPAPVNVACLGLAGFDRPDDRAILTGWANETHVARRLVLVNDGDLVVAAGTPEGWGVGVIAGTGSIAVGRTPDGRTAPRRRLGPPDRRRGQRLSPRPGRAPPGGPPRRRPRPRPDPATSGGPADSDPDPLTARLCRALGVSRASQIVTAIYSPDSTRARIAAMAPEVLVACDEAPEDAARLLGPAGAALGETVAAVARSLGWPSGPLPLAAAGSFLLSATAVRQAMLDDLNRRGYQPALTAVPEPARGAVLLAGRALADDGR